MSKKVYFARCYTQYGAPKDAEFLKFLQQQYPDSVIDPSLPEHSEGAEQSRAENDGDPMPYFFGLIDEADILYFRALPDDGSIYANRITRGVAREIKYTLENGKSVFEFKKNTEGRYILEPINEIPEDRCLWDLEITRLAIAHRTSVGQMETA
jgi:hypothetical protein